MNAERKATKKMKERRRGKEREREREREVLCGCRHSIPPVVTAVSNESCDEELSFEHYLSMRKTNWGGRIKC